jgi:hypothetical protein
MKVKVKILSGNQAGAVVEMSQHEAETNLSTGFAELVPEDASPDVVADVALPEVEVEDQDEEVSASPAKRSHRRK